MKRNRLTRIKITFLIAAVLLVSLSVYSYLRINNLMKTSAWVNHTATVKFELENYFSTMKDVESSMRGYLLTKDSLYLLEFDSFLKNVDECLAGLDQLTVDNYSQRTNLKTLKTLTVKRISDMKSVISIGSIQYVEKQKRMEFRATRAQLRHQVDKMMAEEDMLLRIRKKSLIKESTLTPFLAIFLTVGSIIVLIASYYSIYRELKTSNALRADLEDKNDSLEKMNKELESFTYISSHDLQEPLRKIQTFVSILLEKEGEQLSETAKNYLKRSQDSANRMQNLIRDLLAYSRLSVEVFPTQTIDLPALVSEIKADFEEEIQNGKVHFVLIGKPEVTVIVSQFRQLLINLISNSVKFAQPGQPAHITIENQTVYGSENPETMATPERQFAKITFSDRGIGFEPQYSDRIFKVFQRLHIEQEYKGTGIGLAIVKKIIENHNGYISVKSEVNQGTAFTIFLPLNS